MSTLWLKNNKVLFNNNSSGIYICASCPCVADNCIYPGIEGIGFPISSGMGDYTAALTNYAWEYVGTDGTIRYDVSSDYFYDPCTGLWQPYPFIKCIEDFPTCSKYWGWDSSESPLCDYTTQITGAVNVSNCGVASKEEYEKPHWFLYPQETITIGENIYYVNYSDLPAKMPNVRDYGLKPEHLYTWNTYSDITMTTLICKGKIKFEYTGYEVSITDFAPEVPDYVVYPFTISETGGDANVKVSMYDIDGNFKFSYTSIAHIPETTTLPCVEDMTYAIIGKCSYTDKDCEGCLYETLLKIVPEYHLDNLMGCHNVAGGSSMGTIKSYNYSLIKGSFIDQATAMSYLNEHRIELTDALKSSCKKGSWSLTGKCKCNDDTSCTYCGYNSEDIAIQCSSDIEACYQDTTDNLYYKIVTFETFDTYKEAADYRTEHLAELIVLLKVACPRYYGIRIQSSNSDYPIIVTGCLRGFPEDVIWEESTLEYYQENPDEFTAVYGTYAVFAIVTGPMPSYDAVNALYKKYRYTFERWSGWDCSGTQDTNAHVCGNWFTTPNMVLPSGCPGGSNPDVGCSNYGSRRYVSITEDESCE